MDLFFLRCQITIYDNSFTKGRTTFEKELNYNTEEDFELFDLEREFNIKKIEVYEVVAEKKSKNESVSAY